MYELLDETMDYGYPQNCSIDVLKMYINLGSLTVRPYQSIPPLVKSSKRS